MSEKIIPNKLAESLERTPSRRLLKVFINFKTANPERTLTLGMFKEMCPKGDEDKFNESVHYLMESELIAVGRSVVWTPEQVPTLSDDLVVEHYDATAA